MPSLRHRLATLVVSTTMRSALAPTDRVAADRIRSDRPDTPPEPPRRATRSVQVTTDTSFGFPVYTLCPRGPADGPRILYLHGGAYVSDLAAAHWAFVVRLVERLGATVVLPRYPLAPEATWHTSRKALLELARGAGDVSPVLMGDSAGAGLALALAAELGPDADRSPALVLISPWVDVTLAQPDAALTACRDPWLRADTLRQAGRLWAGGDDAARPEVSPLHADLRHLPPTLVLTGTRDILHPQALDLVRAMEAAGVETDLETGDGLIHVYPLLPTPEAGTAFARIASFLDAHPDRRP